MVEEEQFYNLAIFKVDGQEVAVDGFSANVNLEDKPLTASNQDTPYGVIFPRITNDFEIKDIKPTLRPFFEKLVQRHRENPSDLVTLNTYVLNKGSKHVGVNNFYKAYVNNLSHDLPNLPFTAKGKCFENETAPNAPGRVR